MRRWQLQILCHVQTKHCAFPVFLHKENSAHARTTTVTAFACLTNRATRKKEWKAVPASWSDGWEMNKKHRHSLWTRIEYYAKKEGAMVSVDFSRLLTNKSWFYYAWWIQFFCFDSSLFFNFEILNVWFSFFFRSIPAWIWFCWYHPCHHILC